MIAKANAKKTNNKDLVATLDVMNDLYSDLALESKLSSDVLKNNMSTEFANEIKKAIENPLGAMYTTRKTMDIAIKDVLNDVVLDFLLKHKSNIKRLFNPYPNNKLVYTIVLKKDDVSHRAKILEFNRKYEWSEYAKSYDIAFLFIPEHLEKGLIGTEIKLG